MISVAVMAPELAIPFMGVHVPIWFISFVSLLSLGLTAFFSKEVFKFYHSKKYKTNNGGDINLKWVMEQMIQNDTKHTQAMEQIATIVEAQNREIRQLIDFLKIMVQNK